MGLKAHFFFPASAENSGRQPAYKCCGPAVAKAKAGQARRSLWRRRVECFGGAGPLSKTTAGLRMDYDRLLNQIEQLVTPVLDPLGFELIEREFIFEQGRWILRLYIDREAPPPVSGLQARFAGKTGGGEGTSVTPPSVSGLQARSAGETGGGVTIDDCETASRALEGVLDVENLIPHRYSLEVSSPGLNRPLRRPKDFERFAGEKVDVKTKQALDGRHHFTGILKGINENQVVILEGDREWQIPLEEVKKARLKYEF